MSPLAYRGNILFVDGSGSPDLASGYDVVAYPPGARVAIGSGTPTTTLTVREGHGFKKDDKFIVCSGGVIDAAKYATVTVDPSVNELTIASGITIAEGDILINLGPDTGVGAPNYDGSPLSIHATMDTSGGAQSNATVTTDSVGAYEYWTNHARIWELVLDDVGAPDRLLRDVLDEGENHKLFDVLEFGAVANDPSAAARNVVAIQAAIDAATPGGVVYFPGGRYCIDDSLVVRDAVTLRGAGRQASGLYVYKLSGELQVGLAGALIKGDGHAIAGVVIESLRLSNYTQAASGGVAIDLTDVSHASVRDVVIDEVETGVLLSGVARANNVSNSFISNTTTGISITAGASASSVSECRVVNMTTGIAIANGAGTSTRDIRVEDCILEEFSSYGVDIDGSVDSGQKVSRVRIRGLRLAVSSGTVTGIRIEGPEVELTHIECVEHSGVAEVVADKGDATTYIGVAGSIAASGGVITNDSKQGAIRRYRATVTTTDGTSTRIAPAILVGNGEVLYMRARVWGLRTDGVNARDYRYFRELEGRYYRLSAGTGVTWANTEVATTDGADTRIGFTTATAVISRDGTDTAEVTVTVTGEIGMTVDWIAEIEAFYEGRPAGA